MIEKKHGEVPSFSFDLFEKFPQVCCAASTRNGGVSNEPYSSLNLGLHVGDDTEHVLENRQRFFQSTGFPLERLVTGQQVHGNTVRVVTEQDSGKGANNWEEAFPATDALVTNVRNLPLMVLTADCVPVVFFDPEHGAIGVAHAGWRGVVNGVLEKTLETMAEQFGSVAHKMLVAVGPHISSRKYEVGEELTDTFTAKFGQMSKNFFTHSSQGKLHLDLQKAIDWQLQQQGIEEQNIEVSEYCTATSTEIFFSHRAENGKTGRFGTVVMLKE